MKNFSKLLGFVAGIALASLLSLPVDAATTWNATLHGGAGGTTIGQYVAQGAPGTAITGTTTETVLANILIPAGLVTAGDEVSVTTYWNFTGVAGTKTTKVYLNSTAVAGGTAYLNVAGGATDLSANYVTFLFPTASNAEVGGLVGGAVGRFTSVLPSGSIDLTLPAYLVLTATLASAADTATLVGYSIIVNKNN